MKQVGDYPMVRIYPNTVICVKNPNWFCFFFSSSNNDTGGYVPRYRRKQLDEGDMASSSNASSMNDLHVTRKDSSASSEGVENAPCKLTYENLKLHDKLSSHAPYSSLSRLEESPVPSAVPVTRREETIETIR